MIFLDRNITLMIQLIYFEILPLWYFVSSTPFFHFQKKSGIYKDLKFFILKNQEFMRPFFPDNKKIRTSLQGLVLPCIQGRWVSISTSEYSSKLEVKTTSVTFHYSYNLIIQLHWGEGGRGEREGEVCMTFHIP